MRVKTEFIARYWNQPDIWDEQLNELDTVRIPRTIAMIPDDVRTVVEIGCGNGRLANRIPSGIEVIGLDISKTALRFMKGKKVVGYSDRLPFGDRSVDCVLCADVLEHLPDALLSATVREMQRVAQRYLLIGVPYKEPYQAAFVKCPACRCVSHVYGHQRSFDGAALDRLFPGYSIVATEFVGGPRKYFNTVLLWGQQRLGGLYWGTEGKAICPECGRPVNHSPSRNLLQKVVGKCCYLGNEFLEQLIPTYLKPQHEIIRLYRR